MKEVFLALLAGVLVGAVFRLIKLPIPAPPVFSAVIGVFGVYFGGKLVKIVFKLLGK